MERLTATVTVLCTTWPQRGNNEPEVTVEHLGLEGFNVALTSSTSLRKLVARFWNLAAGISSQRAVRALVRRAPDVG